MLLAYSIAKVFDVAIEDLFDFEEAEKMIELFESIINNKTILVIGTYYCIPITIAVIVLFFLKTSRDERGRAIIGKRVLYLRLCLLFSSMFLQNFLCGHLWIFIVWLTVYNGYIILY